MRVAHGTVSCWAPELVITTYRENSLYVLLVRYEGGVEEFRGLWHIPGGYNNFSEPYFQTTCSAIAKRELGCDVCFVRPLGVHKWKDGEHPYGRPLSIYAECQLRDLNEFRESETVKFFPVEGLPLEVVGPHRRFLEAFYNRPGWQPRK